MRNSPNRFPPIEPQNYTEAQREAVAALASGPRGELRGPFVPLLYSPLMLDRAQKLGEYLRYQSAIPEPLREFAILVAAKHWRQGYEWHVHAPLAAKAGIPQALIDDLAAGRTPAQISTEQELIYHFCKQVHETGKADDDLFARAKEFLGLNGIIDLLGVCGYYAMLAMVLNVAQTPVPGGPRDGFV